MALVILAIFTVQARRLQARADKAREQAEELIAFMLGDLQSQLRAVGRLDGLDGAGRKVLEYFEALDAHDLDSRTVARHAKALHQLGDVRMAQGRLDEALEMFQRAVAQTRTLVKRDPDDLEALFELSQGRFWVGNVFFEMGDFPSALVEMRAYLETSQELHALQPEDDGQLIEVADGHNNVGALLARLGNSALAREHYVSALDISRQLLERNPADGYLRRQQVEAQLRVGQMLESEGELRAAQASYADAVESARVHYEKDPEDTESATTLALAYDYQGGTALYLGDLEEARRLRRLQLEILEELRRTEAEQVDWGDLLASARYKMAEVLTWHGETAQPLALLHQAIEWHEEMSQQGVPRAWDREQLAELWVGKAQLYLLRGNLDAAQEAAQRSLTIGERVWREDFDAKWIMRETAEALNLSRMNFYRRLEQSPNVRKAADLELPEIEDALSRAHGDVEVAALALRVSMQGLKRRMTELGMSWS